MSNGSYLNVVYLDEWGMASDEDPYRPPEAQRWTFKGKVYGHKFFENGHFVRTSVPMCGSSEDMCFQSRSGTVYILGVPDPEYLALDPDLVKTKKFLDYLEEPCPEIAQQILDDKEMNHEE